MKKGGKLLLKDEQTATIAEIRTEQKVLPVYNLEVANAHTFYVGEEGVLVHNAKKCIEVGDTKINKKIENHNEREGFPPKDDHIHFGKDKTGRENAIYRDGNMRHGSPPTNAVRKVINKLFGG